MVSVQLETMVEVHRDVFGLTFKKRNFHVQVPVEWKDSKEWSHIQTLLDYFLRKHHRNDVPSHDIATRAVLDLQTRLSQDSEKSLFENVTKLLSEHQKQILDKDLDIVLDERHPREG
jgi:hypothetical protein